MYKGKKPSIIVAQIMYEKERNNRFKSTIEIFPSCKIQRAKTAKLNTSLCFNFHKHIFSFNFALR